MISKEIAKLIVKDIMTKRVVTIKEDTKVIDAIKQMYLLNLGAVIVLDKNDKLVGIFSERDILRRVIPHNLNTQKTQVSIVMTAYPVSINSKASIFEVFKIMKGLNCRHVPVVDGEKVVGIVSLKDIAKACMDIAAKESKISIE